MSEVVPEHFAQSKFESFTRQLNGWGFKRLHQSGNDFNAYYHDSFLRGLPHLTALMKRQKSNLGKLLPHVEGEPNFYEIDRQFPLPRLPGRLDSASHAASARYAPHPSGPYPSGPPPPHPAYHPAYPYAGLPAADAPAPALAYAPPYTPSYTPSYPSHPPAPPYHPHERYHPYPYPPVPSPDGAWDCRDAPPPYSATDAEFRDVVPRWG